MKIRILILGILVAVFLISSHLKGQGPQTRTKLIKEVFHTYTQEEGVHNAFFQIESAELEINESFVFGAFKNGNKVTSNTPFYTASIGKTFTATAIAQLVDAGKLGFNDRVVDYLGDMISGLHVINEQDYTNELKIHHLLNHTSGLADYFEDRPKGDQPNMIQGLFVEPNRFWMPQELLTFSKENFSALFKPGSGYHYTDTEYVLLGLIIEKITGKKLHEYFEESLFKPLSLELTSMNLRSEPIQQPDFPLAEIYVGPTEISHFKSLSADWAGGAIRSTGKDLNAFLKALLNGDLIKGITLSQMQKWIPESKGTYYGYGLRKWVLNELSSELPKLTIIGHSGLTGSFMYYCPELDTYLSGTFNQTELLQNHIVFIAELLTKLKANN
tara:strand:+ start:12066 stop:13223 length:1158 start_codon:yes stop_codon:yes gene_type:complete